MVFGSFPNVTWTFSEANAAAISLAYTHAHIYYGCLLWRWNYITVSAQSEDEFGQTILSTPKGTELKQPRNWNSHDFSCYCIIKVTTKIAKLIRRIYFDKMADPGTRDPSKRKEHIDDFKKGKPGIHEPVFINGEQLQVPGCTHLWWSVLGPAHWSNHKQGSSTL